MRRTAIGVWCVVVCAVAGAMATGAAPQDDPYVAARKRMVREAIVEAGVKNQRVIDALAATPRHEFVPASQRRLAYHDMALPIGGQQTISSPFIVAYMTESLDPQPDDKVLEIGTGSGYQAAVLSPLVQHVYTIEIVEELGKRASRTLSDLDYDNVSVRIGDGFQGWPEQAPFDKIIVTCSPEKVPTPLVEQLKEGGLMVVPVGQRYQQILYLLRKVDGQLQSESLRPTLFVPMTGRAEENRQVLPDPAKPEVANGDFESPPDENGFMPGWYYQRQLTWLESDANAAGGNHYVQFRNLEPGDAAHLLQGLPLDGRAVASIELSARVAHENITQGRNRQELPLVAITFYDESRRELGHRWLGPFRGSRDWHQQQATIRVPEDAREALLRIGLFGATGKISFDDVLLRPIARR